MWTCVAYVQVQLNDVDMCCLCADSAFIRLVEDAVVDLLQDERFKDAMDYAAHPLYKDGKRVFGPFRSGLFWQQAELAHPDKSVICVMCYSDATEFYKSVSAHPVFSKFSMLLVSYMCAT